MSYTTRFDGEYSVEPPVSGEELAAIREFCARRHAAPEAENREASGFPSLYCPWELDPSGGVLRSGGVHSSSWMVWLERLITVELANHRIDEAVYSVSQVPV